jgi:hypothetical protein
VIVNHFPHRLKDPGVDKIETDVYAGKTGTNVVGHFAYAVWDELITVLQSLVRRRSNAKTGGWIEGRSSNLLPVR